MLYPGPSIASCTIHNICLYYFFNITCLCESTTILSLRQALYMYMEHVVERTLEVIYTYSTRYGPRQVVYLKQCILDPIFVQCLI